MREGEAPAEPASSAARPEPRPPEGGTGIEGRGAMPQTVNGIGTAVCKAGGDVWGDSYDAMECFVIFFMPIVPYAAYHTFGWNRNQYRRVPIRTTTGLLVRTYMRAW